MAYFISHFLKGAIYLFIFSSITIKLCIGLVILSDSDELQHISTESPDLVETFDPQELMLERRANQQIVIKNLKLETHVRLRYGRTRITLSLSNPHIKPLQSNFRITLPKDAFFTVFKLRRGKSPKFYTATIMKKEEAREMYRFAHFQTNGTVTVGFIELSSELDVNLASYNLKFNLGPGVNIQGFLIYERQIERKDDVYKDAIHIYPMDYKSVVQLFEISVEVEEMETINKVQCSPETEKVYNCTGELNGRNKGSQNKKGVVWRSANVTSEFSSKNPFIFQYDLYQQNTTSAVVMTQSNGNLYFLHLFIPQNLPPIRKHIVFLLDISDSMFGKKLTQLKWSMTEIFDDLSSDDFFSIIAFSSDATVWSPFKGERRKCPLPIPVKPKYTEAALYFIENIEAHGGTDLEYAMLKAFDIIQLFSPHSADDCDNFGSINTPAAIKSKLPLKLSQDVESMIFLLSDGIPTSGLRNSRSLLELFTSFNKNLSVPIQLHSIAYGESADVNFLHALSSLNGGIMKRIGKESTAGVELTNFYTEISSQVVTKIHTLASIQLNETESITQEHILSQVVLVRGAEVLTAGAVFPGLNQSKLIQHPVYYFNWSTKAASSLGHLHFTSKIYDCRSLVTTLPQCLEKIDFYLLRLQAYQLLKKLLLRDYYVEQGFCPKFCVDDYSCNEDDEELDYENVNQKNQTECANPYKEKAIDLALKDGFITPYTAFILSTEPPIDIGLRGNINKNNRSDSTETDKRKESDKRETFTTEEEVEQFPGKLTLNTLNVNIDEVGRPINATNNGTIFESNKRKVTKWLTKIIKQFSKLFEKMDINTAADVPFNHI